VLILVGTADPAYGMCLCSLRCRTGGPRLWIDESEGGLLTVLGYFGLLYNGYFAIWSDVPSSSCFVGLKLDWIGDPWIRKIVTCVWISTPLDLVFCLHSSI
jgi:hypothetical protein